MKYAKSQQSLPTFIPRAFAMVIFVLRTYSFGPPNLIHGRKKNNTRNWAYQRGWISIKVLDINQGPGRPRYLVDLPYFFKANLDYWPRIFSLSITANLSSLNLLLIKNFSRPTMTPLQRFCLGGTWTFTWTSGPLVASYMRCFLALRSFILLSRTHQMNFSTKLPRCLENFFLTGFRSIQ